MVIVLSSLFVFVSDSETNNFCKKNGTDVDDITELVVKLIALNMPVKFT